MRMLASLGLVALATATVAAQPGADPYAQPDPYSQTYAQPQPYAQPPVMQVQLTVDEQWLLQRGYISQGQHIGGGLASLIVGLGVGQAIQGRWGEKGWIFTFGELAAFAGMFYGLVGAFNCGGSNLEYSENPGCEDRYLALMFGSVLAMGVLRTWEVIDAFVAPQTHNNDLRKLRRRLGLEGQYDYYALKPFVAPTRAPNGGAGGIAGVSLRF